MDCSSQQTGGRCDKLTLLDDGSIFATGDTTKRDVYTLTLDNLPANITTIRLEALPDERLPAGGSRSDVL